MCLTAGNGATQVSQYPCPAALDRPCPSVPRATLVGCDELVLVLLYLSSPDPANCVDKKHPPFCCAPSREKSVPFEPRLIVSEILKGRSHKCLREKSKEGKSVKREGEMSQTTMQMLPRRTGQLLMFQSHAIIICKVTFLVPLQIDDVCRIDNVVADQVELICICILLDVLVVQFCQFVASFLFPYWGASTTRLVIHTCTCVVCSEAT